jgi:hypothetical protein
MTPEGLVGFWPLILDWSDMAMGHITQENPASALISQGSRGQRAGCQFEQVYPGPSLTWLEVASDPVFSFDYSQTWSVSGWFWRDANDSVPAPYALFSKMDSTGQTGWEVLLSSTGALTARLVSDLAASQGVEAISQTAAAQDGQWFHFAVCFDGVFRFWLDGRPLESITTFNTPVGNPVNTDTLKFAGRKAGNEANFNGLLRLMRIYDRALSDDEISRIYRKESFVGTHKRLALRRVPPLTQLGRLDLMVAVDLPVAHQAAVSLMVNGHNFVGNGYFGSLDLTLYCGPDGKRPNAALVLFLETTTTESIRRGMNLTLSGQNWSASQGLELWLNNLQTGLTQGITLWIRGQEAQETASLGWFLARNPSEAMTLYLQAPGEQQSQAVPLFVGGETGQNYSLELVVAQVTGASAKGSILYTHGF